MLQEAEAIPYAPSPLFGERLLVLAPHPDDEAIGCGGVVAQHLRSGRRVMIVIATDGTAATQTSDPAGYRDRREDETRRGVERLGTGAVIEFLRVPDRQLESGQIAPRLREILTSYQPDLVLLPSLVEIHPDHIALSRAFCDLLAGDAALTASIAVARIGFYEVSNPLRPNTLVDITAESESKYAAISAHTSQMELRDYVAFPRGLNAFRAMSLGPETRFAEAYFVIGAETLRVKPLSALRSEMGLPPESLSPKPVVPITVVVRTRNRPALLAEAIASIQASGHAAAIVVVNDGGVSPSVPTGVQLIEHATSRGRSAAMNAGVAAATTDFIAFLDDDDLYYPEHLQALSNAATNAPGHVGWYSDAVSAFVRLSDSGLQETHKRLRIHSQDFDRNLLLLENFIPLPTLLVRREDYLAAGGFDEAFDLFEDWDFMIRLSRRGSLLHLPRVTCEVRHFETGDSILLASPEGSDAFMKAKLQVWDKHEALLTREVIASAFTAQKKRIQELHSRSVEDSGRRSFVESELARLERDKQDLIAQIGALHETVGQHHVNAAELNGAIGVLREDLATSNARVDELTKRLREIETRSEQDGAALRTALTTAQVEQARLQGLLDMIFASRTWKLHSTLEKLRGR
jgi:LmbE family N-acetylglucosaminyl deacetylase